MEDLIRMAYFDETDLVELMNGAGMTIPPTADAAVQTYSLSWSGRHRHQEVCCRTLCADAGEGARRLPGHLTRVRSYDIELADRIVRYNAGIQAADATNGVPT